MKVAIKNSNNSLHRYENFRTFINLSYNSTTAQQHNSTTAQQHNNSTTAQQHNSTTAQQHNSTTAQQHNSTTAQQHNTYNQELIAKSRWLTTDSHTSIYIKNFHKNTFKGNCSQRCFCIYKPLKRILCQ